jgi:hypothetical protein
LRYELKARTVPEILDGAFKLYRDHFWRLLAISVLGALAIIPAVLIALGVALLSAKAGALRYVVGHSAGWHVPVLFVEVLALTWPLVLASWSLQLCALTGASIDACLGRSFTVGSSFRRALALFFPLLWTSLVLLAGVVVGLALLVVPGLVLFFRGALCLPVLVVEGKSGGAAIRRSFELTRGRAWPLALSLLLLLPVHVALAWGLTVLPTVVLVPLYTAVLTLCYLDCRIRREGWDLELKAAEGVPAAVEAT